MTDRQNKLYVDLSQTSGILPPEAVPDAADGYILASSTPPDGMDIEGKEIMLQDIFPQPDQEMAGLAKTIICSSGIEETARLRDLQPELTWIPRVDVNRQEVGYHFPTTHYSESFRTYQPVFTSQGSYRVDDGDLSLVSWLEKAERLGFSALYLHASRAASLGKGLDLDLREHVLENWSGDLWLSGGASSIMHIKYLVQEGGIDALVVPPDLACSLGCDNIRASLQWGVGLEERKPADIGGGCASGLPRVG